MKYEYRFRQLKIQRWYDDDSVEYTVLKCRSCPFSKVAPRLL